MAHERIPFGKYGPKIDPRGAQIITDGLCTCGRRACLLDVTDCYYSDKGAAGWWLGTRRFNGEEHPPVGASRALVLTREVRIDA